MADQGIKSRPTYQPLRLDRTGLRHLLVAAGASHHVDALSEETDDLEVWMVATPDKEGRMEIFDREAWRSFRSVTQLLDTLHHRLAGERMGLRLYASGPEDFLWHVHNAARDAGMDKHEVFLCQTGSWARRIHCVHCRTFNGGVTTTIVRCAGCGANLFVRDHFSRRLSAFMGVKIDAEVPGDVPPAEQAYR